MRMDKKNEIVKTWISGQRSVTLIIEKKIAEEYDSIGSATRYFRT